MVCWFANKRAVPTTEQTCCYLVAQRPQDKCCCSAEGIAQSGCGSGLVIGDPARGKGVETR